MDIAMDRGGEEPQLARVVKRIKDNEGNPIGMANKNPILDTRVYEIEFQDGFCQPVAANIIAENLFDQVYQERRSHKITDMIIDVRKTDKALTDKDAFDIYSNCMKRRKATTQGWEVCIQCKDRSTTWNTLKDVKDSCTIYLADYALENWTAFNPAFAW